MSDFVCPVIDDDSKDCPDDGCCGCEHRKEESEATENHAPSGQAELLCCEADLAECKKILKALVKAIKGQTEISDFENMFVRRARERAEKFLSK